MVESESEQNESQTINIITIIAKSIGILLILISLAYFTYIKLLNIDVYTSICVSVLTGLGVDAVHRRSKKN